MITANKLGSFLDRFTRHRPVTADVFLNDYCNNSCRYCRYAHRTGEYMKYDLFERVYERLRRLGVRGIILTGGGEPTINPDFDKITGLLESDGFPYGVNTNFNIFHDCRPVFLKVSIDAGSRDEYKTSRGADAFDNVLTNVERFAEGKGVTSMSWQTRLGVQCVVSSFEQARMFYDAVRGLNVDYIQFRPVERRGGGADVGTEFDEWVDIIMGHDRRVTKSYKFQHLHTRFEKCWAHWGAMCVNHKAEVLYCCHRPDAIIGRIFDADILEKCQEYSPDMSLCDIPCRLTGANLAVKEMTDNPDWERFFI